MTHTQVDILRQEAKAWLGTPHRNKMRRLGVGVDCINFVCACYAKLGLVYQLPQYDVMKGLHKYSSGICDSVEATGQFEKVLTPSDGDILVFKQIKSSAHVGLFLDNKVYHALANNLVCAHDFTTWSDKVDTIFKLKEIA